MTAEIVKLFPSKDSRKRAIVIFETNTRTMRPSLALDNWAMLWLDYAEEFNPDSYERAQELWISFNMVYPYQQPRSMSGLVVLVLILIWMAMSAVIGALFAI